MTRVWVYPEKQWRTLGEVRWEVSWWETPANWALLSDDVRENFDPAMLPEKARAFTTEREARRFAKAQAKSCRNHFGAAYVTRQAVDWFVEEDRVAEWSNTSESEEVTA